MIRPGSFEDIPAAAAMRQRAWPDTIITPEGMRHTLANVPSRAELLTLAYEDAGELAGWASASRAWWVADPGKGVASIAVDPKHRGRGIASRLMDALELHLARLDVTTVRSESMDEPAARALAEARGFGETGSSSRSAVDPRTVEPLPLPDGVTVLPFAELDDPEAVWALDLEVAQDIPNEEFDAIDLDEWTREFWRSPVVDDEASLAAFVAGELVAMTMIRIDRASGRAQNNLAGTRRAYRGRGIATALKSHSLRRAAELGATIAITDNEERNAPMLAVNAKLGYRPFARRVAWERTSRPTHETGIHARGSSSPT
jgi:GNAT superfamily N-acetyltransferase